MQTIAGAVYKPQAVRKFNAQLTTEMKPVIERIQGILTSAATQQSKDTKGNTIYVIPASSENRVLRETGDLIQRFFVGPDFRSAFAEDGVTPLATYPRTLNYWLSWVTMQVVKKHTTYMKRHLPADIERWLMRAMTREQKRPNTTNPLAAYDAPHTWVDPNGYRLSDRIWQSSIEVRSRMDALIADGIREGRSAVEIAKDLEPFLLPDRAGLTTNKPYGSKGSSDALRLARSEIGRAHSEAAYIAAQTNPFVDGMDFKTSTSHPKIDICDDFATISSSGTRIRDPYPLTGYVPLPIVDTHPLCLCIIFAVIMDSVKSTVDELRESMGQGETPPVTPVDAFGFVKKLLGTYLASLVFQEALKP